MMTVTPSHSELTDVYRTLRDRLYDLSTSEPSAPILRVQVSAPPVDFLSWLDAQPHNLRIYWQTRDGVSETAGVGAADAIESSEHDRLADALTLIGRRTAGSDAQYFGGLCFDPHRPPNDSAWRRFGAFRFVLPRLELHRDRTGTRLTLNLRRDELSPTCIGDVTADLRTLHDPDSPDDTKLTLIGGWRHHPDLDGWNQAIDYALKLISENRLAKVVPARRTDGVISAPCSPWRILHRLRGDTNGRYLFGFQIDDAAFIGASPECLYRRLGRTIESEAVAGTGRVSGDPAADRRLAEELLASDKDRREHNHVVEHLKSAFQALHVDFSSDAEPGFIEVPGARHLITSFKGKLTEEASDAAILEALNPTPAVGGTPSAAALEHLRAHEPFDRGWYAGPFGRVEAASAEFTVAIRSALIVGDRISLYAGAGIVEGSDPAREWSELDTKIAPFTRLFR
jgi:menaquinone-specific isochorismate synthase